MADRFLTNPRGDWNHESVRREARILRDRMAAHDQALDLGADRSQSYSAARMLVQVCNGGVMPTIVPAVYCTHPISITGAEAEGAGGTFTTHTDTTIPVVVLGNVPSVDDYLIANAIGGRWVAERRGSSGGGSITCSPCNIPIEDLTITWTNAFTGTSSATMTYTSGLELWTTGCVDDGLQFRISCNEGTIELRAVFFLSGSCPTGTSNYCSNLRSSPVALTISDHTCFPFSVTFTVAEGDCPPIYGEGNTQFVITL
jgi:hypothetical protein